MPPPHQTPQRAAPSPLLPLAASPPTPPAADPNDQMAGRQRTTTQSTPFRVQKWSRRRIDRVSVLSRDPCKETHRRVSQNNVREPYKMCFRTLYERPQIIHESTNQIWISGSTIKNARRRWTDHGGPFASEHAYGRRDVRRVCLCVERRSGDFNRG